MGRRNRSHAIRTMAIGLLSFQGLFRHMGSEWWPTLPPTEDEEEDDWDFVQTQAAYVKYGGRHPSLPPECLDAHSASY